MPDIFDQVATESPKGPPPSAPKDIFDEVSHETASDTGRLSLGKTSISSDSPLKQGIRKFMGMLPDIGESAGAAAGGVAAAGTGGADAPLAVPAGMGIGRMVGQGVYNGVMGFMRPSWMDHPSLQEEITSPIKAGVEAAARGAGAELVGVFGSKAMSSPVDLEGRASKLVRALNITDEPRATASKMPQAITDVMDTAKRNGSRVDSSASLEKVAARAVQEFQERIDKFFTPEVAKNVTLDGDKISQAIIGNIPENIQKGKPSMAASIAKEAGNWKGPLTGEQARNILRDINIEDARYHSATPAEKLRADLQRKYLVNEAVANEIRAQLYPQVADVSGPGMKELMRRQGQVIQLRNAAHNVAESEFVNPPKSGIYKGVKSAFGLASGKPLPVINGIIDYSKADINPSSMIKDVFQGAKFPEAKYPTPNPPGPMVNLSKSISGVETVPKTAFPAKDFETPAVLEKKVKVPNSTFSHRDLEQLQAEGESELPRVTDKRRVPPMAGEANKAKRLPKTDIPTLSKIQRTEGVTPFKRGTPPPAAAETKQLAQPPNFIQNAGTSEVSPKRFTPGTEQTPRGAKQIADTIKVGATKDKAITLDTALDQWTSQGMSREAVLKQVSHHLPPMADPETFLDQWAKQKMMRLKSGNVREIEQSKNPWVLYQNMITALAK